MPETRPTELHLSCALEEPLCWQPRPARETGFHQPVVSVRAGQAVVHLQGYCLTPEGAFIEPPELARQVERLGLDVLDHLDGSFLLAVSDPARNECWCATDPAGTLALYYRIGPDRLTITTSPRELGDPAPSAAALDADGLLAFLNSGYPWGESTLLRHWKVLGPARTLAVRRHRQVSLGEYFAPESEGGCKPFASPEDFLAELDRILCSIATRRKRILVPLSGGVDSRLLAVRCAALGIPFETVTFVADRRIQNDDFEVARLVSAALGVKHHAWPWNPPRCVAAFWELAVASAGTNAAFTSYPDGMRRFWEIAGQFDCVLRGDQVFGFKATAGTVREAAEALGIRLEDDLSRWVAQGAKPFDPVGEILARRGDGRTDLAGQEADAWKNRFCRVTRVPRFVMPVARWQARGVAIEYPFLRRSFVSRIVGCTQAQRNKKAIARSALAMASPPEVQKVPFATTPTWPGGEPLLCLPRKVLEQMASEFRQPSLLDQFIDPERVLAAFRQWAATVPRRFQPVSRGLLGRATDLMRRAFRRPAARTAAWPERSSQVPDHLLFKRLWAARVYLLTLARNTSGPAPR